MDQRFNKVVAVDKELCPEVVAKTFPVDRFSFINSSFEEFQFSTDEYDLVNAQYSLPFIRTDKFMQVWSAIFQSLRSGGVFAGQLFGDRDEWSSTKNMTFHSKKEAERLFLDMNLIKLEEEEKDGQTADDVAKHWHLFHFIAQKK